MRADFLHGFIPKQIWQCQSQQTPWAARGQMVRNAQNGKIILLEFFEGIRLCSQTQPEIPLRTKKIGSQVGPRGPENHPRAKHSINLLPRQRPEATTSSYRLEAS